MHQYFEGEQFRGYFLVYVLYYEKIWKAGYAQLESFAYSGLIHFFFSFFQQDLWLKLCWKLDSFGMERLAVAHWAMKLTKGHTYQGILVVVLAVVLVGKPCGLFEQGSGLLHVDYSW